MTSLRALLLNKDGFPELEDLPHRWERTYEKRPIGSPELRQVLLLWWYERMASTKPWAWEGLRRLLIALRERGEEIPDPLIAWALDVACELRKPPRRKRGPLRTDHRDVRMLEVLEILLIKGRKKGSRDCRNRARDEPVARCRSGGCSQGEGAGPHAYDQLAWFLALRREHLLFSGRRSFPATRVPVRTPSFGANGEPSPSPSRLVASAGSHGSRRETNDPRRTQGKPHRPRMQFRGRASPASSASILAPSNDTRAVT